MSWYTNLFKKEEPEKEEEKEVEYDPCHCIGDTEEVAIKSAKELFKKLSTKQFCGRRDIDVFKKDVSYKSFVRHAPFYKCDTYQYSFSKPVRHNDLWSVLSLEGWYVHSKSHEHYSNEKGDYEKCPITGKVKCIKKYKLVK